jgi:hypothetical protein
MKDFLVIGPFGAVAGSNIFDHIKDAPGSNRKE